MYMRPARENTHQEADNMRHLVWNLEKAIACTTRRSQQVASPEEEEEQPQQLEKINLIIDYDGFKLKNAPPLSTSKYTLEILQNHYPERMYRIYCLNPPTVFRVFWNLVRPFVDPVTKEKVVFCSGKTGMEKLKQAAGDLSVLEEVAGGTPPFREFDTKEYVNLPFNVAFDE